MSEGSNIHVIFGSGPLGQSVMRALSRGGERVRMVNRSGRAPENTPAGVEITRADLYLPADVRRAAQGAAVVYQCSQPEYTRWAEDFPRLQKSILDGLEACGETASERPRLVMGDNLYMYGPVEGKIHEGLPYAAHTRKGRIRARMAEELLEAHRMGRLRVTIGRGSDFFGPGVLGSLAGETIFGALAKGKAASILGNPDLPHSYTFIDNFGKALVILGEREEALGQAWHVPNAQAVTTRQLVTLAASAFGTQPKMMVANGLVMRLVGLFVPVVREMIELEYEVVKPYVVDDSKFKTAFGDHSTPLNEAVRQTADWFSKH
jgi:nucleoside-diphosphate-sugar epimerase